MPDSNILPEDLKRWTAKRKAAVVIEIIKGKTSSAEISRAQALTVAEVESWVRDFLDGGTEQLRSHPRDLQAQHEAQTRQLYAKIGEQSLEIDVLKKAHRILGKDLPEGIS